MKMSLKAGFLTLCMSALATAPAVTITTLATADAAYAKGGNGNGNGSKGHGRGGNKSVVRGPKTLGEFFGSLTGQNRKSTPTTRGQSGRKTVPVTTEAPAKRSAKLVAGLHPSQMGNMNAAYNANINAILSHIRNGNLHGPIGAMAGLAIATSTSELTPQEARANQELAAAYDAAAKLLADAGYEGETSEEIVRNYLAASEQNLEDVNTAIDQIARNEDNSLKSYPTSSELAASSDVIAAEDYVVLVWNKSDAANDEDTASLLDALSGRFEEHQSAIDQSQRSKPKTTF